MKKLNRLFQWLRLASDRALVTREIRRAERDSNDEIQPYDPYAHDIAQFDWRDSRDLTKQ